jgi:hypothetical protein
LESTQIFDHDFGSVAIDFRIHHTFGWKNTLDRPVRLQQIDNNCDCTTVLVGDSLLDPGETLRLETTLNTRNLFGRVNKGFTIRFDDATLDEMKYSMAAVVGQWPGGVRPQPLSLFFLPGTKSKTIVIHNPSHQRISLDSDHGISQYDSSFVAEVLVNEARKGQNLSLKISRSLDLAPDTYISSFTLRLNIDGQSEPMILTIPIKVVMY